MHWVRSRNGRRRPLARRGARRHRVRPAISLSGWRYASVRYPKKPCGIRVFLPTRVITPRRMGLRGPKNFYHRWNQLIHLAFGSIRCDPFGHTKGFRVMAGSGRSKDVGPGSVWGLRRSAAEVAFVFTGRFRRSGCARPGSFRVSAIPSPTSSIARFPSATFLPYKSKIADASWCGHDSATALVTSCRLSRPVGFPGGFHATEQ